MPPTEIRGREGRGFLDRSVIEKISTGSKVLKICQGGGGSGMYSEAWAWTYLTACLAVLLGYDEAREVVDVVRYQEMPT